MKLIRIASLSRVEWWWFHPSTTTGYQDIQRNGKWHSNVNVKCRIVGVSLNISASSNCRRTKPPPFNAAWRGGSNELHFILLRSLDAKIIDQTRFLILNFDMLRH